MSNRRERQSLLPTDLMSQKTSPNPSAVPLATTAPAATETPPPVEAVVEKVEPSVQVEQAVEPAPEVQQAVEKVLANVPEHTPGSLFFPMKVHERSVKQSSSQMSVQVSAKMFQHVDNARRKVRGLSGQTILLEGMIMWLIHNRFITPEEAAELLKEQY